MIDRINPTLADVKQLAWTWQVLSLLFVGCAGQPRDIAVAPAPLLNTSAVAPIPAGIAGRFRLTGHLQGAHVYAMMRVDSVGHVSYVGDSPTGVYVCDASAAQSEQLVVRCGTVCLKLGIADDVLAPAARIAFNRPGKSRAEYNPFSCVQVSAEPSCARIPESRAARVLRVTGNVTVERVAE